MEQVTISFEDVSYPLFYGYDCLDSIHEQLLRLGADLYVLVTDGNVVELYGREMEARLKRSARVLTIVLEPGERSKSLERVLVAAEEILAAGATRSTVVATVGGGIPGNFGGLLAGLLFRGLRLVHVPTTLVSMFDSVLSLKQAVNSTLGKNLIGTYHEPAFVIADLHLLETLPTSDVRSGLCEVIKNALAIDPQQIPALRRRLRRSASYSPDEYRWFLEFSLAAKLKVMARDKREKSTGLVLEYGHTVGHAIELAHLRSSPTPISHGEAVGLGMLVAAQVAFHLGVLDTGAVDAHWDLLDRIGAPQVLPPEVSGEDILAFVARDNKRGYRPLQLGQVNLILLRELGKTLGPAELPLTAVPVETLQVAIDRFRTCAGEVRATT